MAQAMVRCPPNTAPWVYEAEQEERVDQADGARLVQSALLHLAPREERVLRLRFVEENTLRQVGSDIGVCADRVRQIEAKALRKLRRWVWRLAHKQPEQAQSAEPHVEPYDHKRQMRELIAHFRELKRRRERALQQQQAREAEWQERRRQMDEEFRQEQRSWPQSTVYPWSSRLLRHYKEDILNPEFVEIKGDERLNSENGNSVVYVLKHCYASMPQGRIQFMAGERWLMGKEHAEALERLGLVMVLRY